jgi:teichuronic acid biosynthesis glycosyltransferase TuaC
MGSDVQKKLLGSLMLKLFHLLSWQSVIVKSKSMKKKAGIKKCHVIPNGVNFKILKSIEKSTALHNVGFDPQKRHVVFVSDPGRHEKNFKLAEQAFDLLKAQNVELNVVSGVSYEKIPYYLNAADVLILTSLWEGSPNVIKEAMACNLPIVSTDVGDVRDVTGKTEGCFVTSFDPGDVAKKLEKALAFSKRTKGREHIEHLDNMVTAGKIIKIYEDVLG